MPVLGERFRAAREARGLALSAVSEQIRIRSIYLAAIEDENWAAIGAPVYVRGFLRTYARFLGLDAEEVVARFNELSQTAPPSRAPEADARAEAEPERGERPRAQPNLRPLLWLAGIVAVALIAFVVYSAMTMTQASSPQLAAASPAAADGGIAPGATASTPTPIPGAAVTPLAAASSPIAAATGSSAPLAAGASPSAAAGTSPSATTGASLGSPAPLLSPGPNTLALVLSAPSWLRVTVDGNVSIEGTFPAGTTKLFRGKSARVRIGNAGGVEVIVDGKNLGTLGKSGDVVDRSFAL